MDVVVKIKGREALPVWVVPYVIGWQHFSLDMLLVRLVNPHYDPTAFFPAAFTLDKNECSVLLSPEQWEDIAIKTKRVDETIKNEGWPHCTEVDERNKRTIELLQPSWAYIWLDEFKTWFNKQVYAYETYKIDPFDDNAVISGPSVKPCFTPNITDEKHKQYFLNEAKLMNERQKAYYANLPDALPLNEIAELWTTDKKGQESIRKAMLEYYKKGILITENSDENIKNDNLKLHRDNFKNWLIQLHKKPISDCFHDECLLANWWPDELVKQHKSELSSDGINKTDSFSYHAAYKELEKRLLSLSEVEFGLYVFNGDIRIFNKTSDDSGHIKQLTGKTELNEVGNADVVSSNTTPLHLTLSRFSYAKVDIDKFIPNYRYTPFEDACKEIAFFTSKEEHLIKLELIQKATYENISPYHPYCGLVNPERSELYVSSAYPDFKINEILCDAYGVSEFGEAFDVETYLKEGKGKGVSDDEIKRIRSILNKRFEINSTLVERQNAAAELKLHRSNALVEYKIDSNDLIKNLPSFPSNPNLDNRIERLVWIETLIKRKAAVDESIPSLDRTKELAELNQRIDEIKNQLGLKNELDMSYKLAKEQNHVEIQTNKGKEKQKINEKFISFKNLRANKISLLMMEGGKAKVVINNKRIDIFPDDFGLKENSQGWKLLVGAAMVKGELSPALKSLNLTSNREAETNKVTTIISRLNKKLKESMGLQENPIILKPSGYLFIFKAMTHELTDGLNVTKGADAMDYVEESELNEQIHSYNDKNY